MNYLLALRLIERASDSTAKSLTNTAEALKTFLAARELGVDITATEFDADDTDEERGEKALERAQAAIDIIQQLEVDLKKAAAEVALLGTEETLASRKAELFKQALLDLSDAGLELDQDLLLNNVQESYQEATRQAGFLKIALTWCRQNC